MASGKKIKAEEKGTLTERSALNRLILITGFGYSLLKRWRREPRAKEEIAPSFYGSPSGLQLKDALNTAFKLGDHVQSLWNMYLVASVAVVGLAVKADLTPLQKVAVLFLYVAFCAVNGCNLFRMYKWLNAAADDLKREAKRYGDVESKVLAAMRGVRKVGRPGVEGIIYGLVFIAVFVMLVYNIYSGTQGNPPPSAPAAGHAPR
ncbi:MAG TPA: hypothetical protein VF508_12030 [Pyrinomonadaceae bacterium]|jgi:tetrahydromethanopterin S-methyltransferase subunit G